MRLIEGEEVRRLLSPRQCVALMRQALAGLETGENGQPQRMICTMPNSAKFGFMPAFVGSGHFGAKVIAAYPPNAGTGYPSHIGYILLFESRHCSVQALVEAGTVTELRTGAVSAVATDLLARKDARRLALVGAGAQARSHAAAILCVREIERISVYDLSQDSAERFRDETQAAHAVPVAVCASAEEAVRDADIVCTLTPCGEPFLFRHMVRPGTHINAVGAFTPAKRELSSDLVAASSLYADSVEAMKSESGEYLLAMKEGLIAEGHIVGTLGQLILNKVRGRVREDEITVFDALGLAVEDLACARFVYETSARREKAGGQAT